RPYWPSTKSREFEQEVLSPFNRLFCIAATGHGRLTYCGGSPFPAPSRPRVAAPFAGPGCMPVAIDQFWNLAASSKLLSPARCKELDGAFRRRIGAAGPSDTQALAEWLVAGRALSAYQASVLASGRPGPFVFGRYVIVERIESGRLARLFRARCDTAPS